MKNIFLLLILLSACEGSLDGGHVIKKDYRPPYTEWHEDCHGTGSARSCISYPVQHEAQYSLRLQYCPGWNDNECHETWERVSPGDYEGVKTGEWFGSEHPTWVPPPTAGEVFWFVLKFMFIPVAVVVAILFVWRHFHR